MVGSSVIFLRLAAALAVVVAVAGALHLLTSQAAYSPLALALPSGPFAQLEFEALKLAALALGLHAIGADEPRWAVRMLVAAVGIKLVVLAVAASMGMMAVQATDPRVIAPRLFGLRTVANLLLVIATLTLLVPRLRRGRAPGA